MTKLVPLRDQELVAEWVPIDQAMKALGKSKSMVRWLVKQGKLRARKELNAGTGHAVLLVSAADIARVNRENETGRPIEETTSVAPLREAVAPSSPSAPGMRIPAAAGLPAPRPWLTLTQAAKYSGLPARHLADMAASGELKAEKVFGKKVGRWKFRAEALNAMG